MESPGRNIETTGLKVLGESDLTDFDAIVVGSGMSGGWSAKELCERGLKVLVLERGPEIKPERDYVDQLPGSKKLRPNFSR